MATARMAPPNTSEWRTSTSSPCRLRLAVARPPITAPTPIAAVSIP